MSRDFFDRVGQLVCWWVGLLDFTIRTYVLIFIFHFLMYRSDYSVFSVSLWQKLALDNSLAFRKYILIMRVAILSNSYGEDRSGALIGKELIRLCPNIEIISFPLLSFGEEYKKRGIRVIGGSAPPPSGGFFLKSFSGLIKDLIESLPVPSTYMKRLHKNKDEIDLLIVVGDVTLLLMGWITLRRESYFLAPCKSDWMAPHFWIEEQFMKRCTKTVFTHDELTASNLRKNRVNALFLGNPMMDDLIPECRYHPPKGKIIIGVFPGSREESYGNMESVKRVIYALVNRRNDIHFAVSVADTVDFNRMKRGIIVLEGVVDLVRGAFVDILKSSRLVISLAGTASEQAAGLGVPVISFTGTGAQTTMRRLLGQEKLLGKAFQFMNYNPERIAYEIERILQDQNLREVMGKEGIERMGVSGGAKNIAEFILESESN